MKTTSFNLLPADDDAYYRMFFREAPDEPGFFLKRTTINDGVQLMDCLNANTFQPTELIFTNLNMPLKTDSDSLGAIRTNERQKHFPIIISSTSFDQKFADHLYEIAANCYIQKPGAFCQLKKVISRALNPASAKIHISKRKENFVIRILTDNTNDIHKS